jgi:hypothetical protein
MWNDLVTQHSLSRRLRLGLILCVFGVAACGDDGGSKAAPADGGTQTGSGMSGEACSADKLCGKDLVCSSGKCATGNALTLSVDSAARGCELVVRDAADAKLTGVQFGEGVKGSHVRRAPRTGVSFIAVEDEAIAGAHISLLVAGDGEPRIEKTACVDAKGKALPKAIVSVVK